MKPTPDQLKCFAINYYGSGEHPVADESTLSGFTKPYVRQCIEKAIRLDKLDAEALAVAHEVLAAE
jgi:hypothetical protein